MINLNVCGIKFEVEKKILCKSEYFLNMFTDCNVDDNIINVNRSPNIFKHVLAYLIDDNYLYPKKYESELKYFLINYDAKKLYDPNSNLQQQCDKLEYDLDRANTIIDELQNIIINNDDYVKVMEEEIYEKIKKKYKKLIDLYIPATCKYKNCGNYVPYSGTIVCNIHKYEDCDSDSY